MALQKSKWLFGLHEGAEENGLQYYLDKPSWLMFTEEVGHDPNNKNGKNFKEWSDKGFWPIVRINNGYGNGDGTPGAGTIPESKHYKDFSQRVANYVLASPGCLYWTIGNEPNLKIERPNGVVITPEDYAECFLMCYREIINLPGRAGDIVMPAAIGPWNDQSGHWMEYTAIVWSRLVMAGWKGGFNLHTYTHGHTSDLIYSDQRMGSPNEKYKYQFRCYEDFLAIVPAAARSFPVIITEVAQVKAHDGDYNGWRNDPTDFILAEHQQVNEWNNNLNNQTVQGIIQYRFPRKDDWVMVGKGHVMEDFTRTVKTGFLSPEPRVFRTNVTVTDSEVGNPVDKGVVTAFKLNVRNQPGVENTEIVGSLVQGDLVSIYSTRVLNGEGWYQIGKNKWVYGNFVEKIEKPTFPTTPQEKWEKAKAFTLRWEGGYQNLAWDPGNWTGDKAGEGVNLGTKYGISGHCLHPDTLILSSDLTWEKCGELGIGDEIVGFEPGETRGNKLVRSNIIVSSRFNLPSVRVVTDRTEVICSREHLFWSAKGNRSARNYEWVMAKDLVPTDIIAFYRKPWKYNPHPEAQWLSGIIDGEGHVNDGGEVIMYQNPGLVFDRIIQALKQFGFNPVVFEKGDSNNLAIKVQGDERMELMGSLQPTRMSSQGSRLWEGKYVQGKTTQPASVLSIEDLGMQETVGYVTSTGTLIANGLLSHNSYPHLDIKNITKEQAEQIYYNDYWLRSEADKAPWPYSLAIFDAAVNFHPNTAKAWKTQHPNSVIGFMAERLEGYQGSDAWPQAREAWVKRTIDIMKEIAKYE